MAQIPRIFDGEEGKAESAKNRLERVESLLSKTERLLELAAAKEREGDRSTARSYKKIVKGKARMAMRLVGILLVEFGLPMEGEIARIRKLIEGAKNGD
jgi:intergrase/recombinase